MRTVFHNIYKWFHFKTAQSKKGWREDTLNEMKKGQITFFIILGIILLIILGAYLALVNLRPQRDIIQPKYQPLYAYMTGCVESTAREAITRIGENGGFLYEPQEISRDPYAYLTSTLVGVREDPFWWTEGISRVPPEEYLEEQITRYVKENLKTCLNYAPFENEFIITELQEIPDITTELGEEATIIRVSFPLKVVDKATGEENRNLKNFDRTLQIRVKKAYELAKRIMDRENQDTFIERKVIELIGLSSEERIPYTGIDISCKPKTWKVPEVKEELQKLIRVNFPYIKVQGLPIDEDRIVDFDSGLQFKDSYFAKQYVWDIGDVAIPDMRATVIYDDYPMQFAVTPNDGALLKSNMQKGQQALSFLCINMWHFTYDIVFPVMIRISDDENRYHESFMFEFPFMVSIQDNQPKREAFTSTISPSTGGGDVDEFCTTDATDKEIVLTIQDALDKSPIEGAELRMACGSMECSLGYTDDGGELARPLPYCVNAVLKANKTGYEDAERFFQTEVEGREYVMTMQPFKQFELIRVVKHAFTDAESPIGAEQRLASDEQATITLKTETDEYFTLYPQDGDGELPLAVPLVPETTYDVQIYLIKGESIIGGYEAAWKPSFAHLQTADTLTFHVLAYDAPSEEEQFLFLSGLRSYSIKAPEPELE